MTTKRVETKVYTEHKYCECGGELKSDGRGYQVGIYDTKYYHYCDKCNELVELYDMYPRIVYEEVEVEK